MPPRKLELYEQKTTDNGSRQAARRGGAEHGEDADYSVLWDKVNGRGDWDRNKFVWKLQFKETQRPT